jgi:PAS domain S-box-containing protein
MPTPTKAELLADLAALKAETQELQHHRRQLTALLQAQEALTSSLDLERSLEAIVRQAAAITGGNETWLFVLNEESQLLRCRVSVGMSREEMDGLVIPVGEGIAGRIAQNRKPLSIPDMRSHPHVWRRDLATQHRHVSYLGIPVVLGDRLFGVLAFSTPEPRTYTAAEIDFLTLFAKQAAIALENAGLYETAQRELAERTRADASLRESEERYRRISAAVTDYIYTVRVEDSRAAATRHGPGCVAITGYESEDFAADPDLWIRMVNEADRGAVREQACRVLRGEDVPPLEHRITRKDGAERWVRSTVVPHRGANGMLLFYDGLMQDVTERKLVEEVLRGRTRQLDTVRAIGQEITGELDLRALLDLIIERATELVGAEAGAILLWDETAGALIPEAWHGFGDWQKQVRLRLGEGLVGMVAQRRTGMVINNYREWVHAIPMTLTQSRMTAALAEPLLYQDRLLGVIALSNEGVRKSFTEQDRETLTLFVAQAAIAVQNARLYAAAVRRSSQLEALVAATRSVTSGLDLREILDRILAEAARISGAPHVKVLLLDKEAGLLRVGALKGSSMPPGYALPVGVGSSGLVAQTGEPLFMADAQNDPRSIFAEGDRELGIVTYLGLPIKRGNEVLGVLTFNTMVPHNYSGDEMAYLASFADQAAIAIENARLHGAAVRRGQELESLLRATRTVMSEVDLQRILDRIVTEAAEITHCSHVKLLLMDHGGQVLRVGALKGTVLPQDFRMPLGVGLSGRLAVTGEPLFVIDPASDPNNILAEQDWASGVATYLGLPIKSRGRVLGVLTFNTTNRRFYGADELTFLGSFADHAAIAIEKAQLFDELNQSYADLQRAQDELIRAEKLRALGQMSAGIAHDLNNMLAAILGQVELLRLRARDPEVQDALRMLETAATDGAQVVRRLQDFARQRRRSPLAPVNLADIVAESLEITRPRWRDELQRQGLVIDIQVRLDDIPLILGYGPEVREILTNLILNAVDAMAQGGTLTFAARAVATLAERGAEGDLQAQLPLLEYPAWVELQVTDTGVGMSEEVRKRIFDPFFTTKGGRGTGLGLSVVYGIMERHGGRIAVSSTPGHGTTATLHFQTAHAVPERGATPTPRSAVVRKRILLVDDDAMVRRTLASLLRAAGHAVTEAEGGAAGIALLEKDAIDLVLTDLGMPEVTGWDVASAARVRLPQVPVVLLTGWGEHGAAETPAPGLVDRVLGKPVRLEDLLGVIGELTASE